jgi:hypothetical protein
MPTFSTNGAFDLDLELGGVSAVTQTWTQTVAFDEPSTEPANDNPDAGPSCVPLDIATCPTPNVSLPAVINGVIGGADTDDFFNFVTNNTAGLDIEFTLGWNDGDTSNDVDILIIDFAFLFLIGDGGGQTLGNPEHELLDQATCDIVAGLTGHPAGATCSGQAWLTDFGPGISNYTLTIELAE